MKRFMMICALGAVAFTGSASADDKSGFRKLPGQVYVRDYDASAAGTTRLNGNTYIRNGGGDGRSAFVVNDDNVVIYSGNGGGYRRGGYGYGYGAPPVAANPCAGADNRREYRRCLKDAQEAQQDLYDKYN